MTTTTIAGKEYQLGELAFSEANVALFEHFVSIGSDDLKTLPMLEIRRILQESLTAGNGPELATEAMGKLTMNMRQGSDLMNSLEALFKSLGGSE